MSAWLFFPSPTGTNAALSPMDFVYRGQPFVYVPTKTTTDLTTLDIVYKGQAFVSYAKG